MDTWTDLTHLAENRFGVVTRDELLAAGLCDRTVDDWVARGRLVPMARGVFRLGGVPPSFEAEVTAAVLVFDGDTWVSHFTAARLLGISLSGPDRRVHLTRPVELSAQRSIARVHRTTSMPSHHLVKVKGLWVTGASRLVFDLARTVGPVRLGRVVDEALRRRLATMGSLYRVLFEVGGRGVPGTRRMRGLLDARGLDYVPPESELEAVGMAVLAGLGFEWQVELSDEQGYIRRVDGLHRGARLIVEFDGVQHDGEEQRTLDEAHDQRLRALGWDVERLRWADVSRGSEATRARIVKAVRGAAA